jgi:Holliday junction resolvase RusA-like endonuclease
LTFTLLGNPATKGNSPRLVPRGRQILRLPSKAYMRWFREARRQRPVVQLAASSAGVKLPICGRVNVTAIWYRARAVGDEDNFKKGLGDYLERDGIIENDKHVHWTGETRLDKDAVRPRVEVTIEVVY